MYELSLSCPVMTTVAADRSCSRAEGGSRILSPWRVEVGVSRIDSCAVHFRVCFDSVMIGSHESEER